MHRILFGRASLPFSHVPVMQSLPKCLNSVRFAASYPAPGTSRAVRGNRKKFNYLTTQRLVENEKETRNRRKIRMRDDVLLKRRTNYREFIKKSVETQIRYFSERVKYFVFFRSKHNSLANTGFRGARKLPGWLMRRITLLLEDEILKPANRQHLIELIQSTGVKPPTATEWGRYTDKKGNININLYFHAKVENFLRGFCLEKNSGENLKKIQAFAILNRNNFAVCPPTRFWSTQQGPIQNEELKERGEEKVKRDIAYELEEFHSSAIFTAFNKISASGKEAVLKAAESKMKDLRREYERERVFAAKVLCGVSALKEIRSLMNPAFTYYNEVYYKCLIRKGGSLDVTLNSAKKEVTPWPSLTKEQRLEYYCFGCMVESSPVGGSHLYTRYCSRDYGIPRDAAVERWAQLTDLQKAALEFCFFAPISARGQAMTSFRRFYTIQCRRHGLMMTGAACGNRAFLARVRKLWMSMNADERAKYEDREEFASVFPLQPTKNAQFANLEDDDAPTVQREKVELCDSQTKHPNLVVDRNGNAGQMEVEAGAEGNDDEEDSFYFQDEIIDEGNEDDDCNPDHITASSTNSQTPNLIATQSNVGRLAFTI